MALGKVERLVLGYVRRHRDALINDVLETRRYEKQRLIEGEPRKRVENYLDRLTAALVDGKPAFEARDYAMEPFEFYNTEGKGGARGTITWDDHRFVRDNVHSNVEWLCRQATLQVRHPGKKCHQGARLYRERKDDDPGIMFAASNLDNYCTLPLGHLGLRYDHNKAKKPKCGCTIQPNCRRHNRGA